MLTPLDSTRAGRGRALACLVALLGLALAGCGSGPIEDSQVLVRVNADDISVHQLNLAIAQAPRKITAEPERMALLEKMIDRQLAFQRSLALGLDRRPEVMLRLEEARRDILAAAYAEDLSGKLQEPDEAASIAYFAEHPGLFANRRIYRLREVMVLEDSPVMAEAESRLQRKERSIDVMAWLRRQQAGFSDQLVLRPAEQLPIEIADRLSKVKSGDAIAFRLPRSLVLYEVLAAEAAPIPWAAAAPIIKAHLAKQQGAEAFSRELKRLREAARINRYPLGGQRSNAG